MKPLIFGLDDRPTIFLSGLSEGPTQIVEMGPGYVIVNSREPIALRGELKFENVSYKFTKKEEQNIDGLFYTHLSLSQEDAKDLYRKLLVRLPTEDLSSWLLENLSGSKDTFAEEHDDAHLIPPRDFLSQLVGKVVTTFYQWPWLSLAILILLSLFPAYHIRHLKMDPSLDRILIQDSPDMKIYKESVNLFGSDKSAVLFIQDKDILKPEKLKVLRELAWDLQKWPEIKKVDSVFTSTFIRDQEDTLYTEPAFQDLKQINEPLLQKLKEDPILHKRLIDIPNKILVFNLQVDLRTKKVSALAKKLNKKIAPLKKDFDTFYQTGEPLIENFNEREMISGPKIFLPLIAFILFVGFVYFIRSIDAFVITIVGTFFSILWSFGIMTFFDIPIQVMIVLVPGITLTLSATEIVHLISSYKTGLKRNLSQRDALKFMADDIGKAICLTFTSTLLGFLTIRFSEIQVLQEFALVASMTLFFDFIVTLLYLPIHMRWLSRSHQQQEVKGASQIFELPLFDKLRHVFYRFYLKTFFSKGPITVLLLFLGIHLFWARKVRMDNDNIQMIAPYTQERKDIHDFQNKIGGMKGIHLVLESDEALTNPKNLQLLWQLHNKIKEIPEVVDVQSIAGVMALMNQEMRSGDKSHYNIPDSRNLISQYMLTLSRDDVDPYLSPDKKKANLRLSHDVSSSVETKKFITRMKGIISNVLQENSQHSIKNHFLTSRNILNIQAGNTIIKSQTESLFTMSIVIILIVSFFFRSLRVGLISLIPNLIPIIGLFGIMGLLDIPLNIGTCVVAAVTIGIAADDTIHLFSRYFKDRLVDSNPFSTGRESIHEELIPIFTTSLTLSLSFATFLISKIIPVLEFGVLSAYVLILAVISDLYVGPFILTYFDLRKSKSTKNYYAYLLGEKALGPKSDLKDLSFQELFKLLTHGQFVAHKGGQIVPSKENLTFVISGPLKEHSEGRLVTKPDQTTQDDTIIFTIPQKALSHLSPRIFEKFCHNLKE